MKTSARNELRGTVAAVKRGAVNDEIEIALPGGERIVAVVTRASTEALGLAPGVEAIALVKASWAVIVTEDDDMMFSARNRLAGRIDRVTRGAINSEVLLRTDAGSLITAVVTNESCDHLGLQAGAAAAAVFKASQVIVAVPRKKG